LDALPWHVTLVTRLPNQDGGDYRVLHSFPTVPTDGRMPRSALVEGADGALYGTTQNGGPGDNGTIFRLNKDGSDYRVLHSFNRVVRQRGRAHQQHRLGAAPFAGLWRIRFRRIQSPAYAASRLAALRWLALR
jgi:uncharacterized repeat protein (TIGR03803 family)